MVLNSGVVFNTGGRKNGGVGGKKGYIYVTSCDFTIKLVRYCNFDSYTAFCCLMIMKQPSLHQAQPRGTLWMRNLETWFGTRSEESWRLEALHLHHIPLVLLRHRASQSKLSSAQVVTTVQPSKMATNTPSGGKNTHNRWHRIQNTSLFDLRGFELCRRSISSGKLKIYKIDRSKYCAMNQCNSIIHAPRRQNHPSSGANRPSDVAVIVNINAQFNLSLIWWQ